MVGWAGFREGFFYNLDRTIWNIHDLTAIWFSEGSVLCMPPLPNSVWSCPRSIQFPLLFSFSEEKERDVLVGQRRRSDKE
ncbi:hypothetical protein BB560_003332 [Smittium megazygosporum]|uniref:Uncharacterized protein n=1 Tax=Smittium megazygosporum TaxID=133381 RepID=A0A2T9ZC93_9FUNG|nr:hypothetical protein BB560_003332 [Smittium megazygosporum]